MQKEEHGQFFACDSRKLTLHNCFSRLQYNKECGFIRCHKSRHTQGLLLISSEASACSTPIAKGFPQYHKRILLESESPARTNVRDNIPSKAHTVAKLLWKQVSQTPLLTRLTAAVFPLTLHT